MDDIERMPTISGYTSEFNQQAKAWTRAMGDWFEQGAAIIIDYGFPAVEYYHPQRHQGTLMCHSLPCPCGSTELPWHSGYYGTCRL